MKNKFLFGLVVALFVTASPQLSRQYAFADHVHSADEQEIVVLSTGILHQVKALLRAEAADREKVADQLRINILLRKEKLLQLLEKNPSAALHLLLPSETVSLLPDDVRELLEADVNLNGQLSTLIANFPDGTVRTFYTLRNGSDAQSYQIYFAGTAPQLPSGSVVSVKGKKVDAQHVVLEANGNNTSSSFQTIQVAATSVSGNQNTLVIPISFKDSTVPCSDAALNDLFFTGTNSIKNYYADSSFNQINVTGMVAPRVTIPYNSTDACNYSAWSSAADSAVAATGINLSSYPRRVYQFPSTSCGYIGLGTIGGNPSQAWIFRCDIADVSAHEYGHNLGWHHASTGTLTTAGDEYGDTSCIMGYSGVGLRHPNTVHKVESGWIPSSRVQTVTNNGTYNIYLSEVGNTTSFQALKIHKADTSEDYYVSFRHPTGFDSNLAGSYADKVSIHRWSGVSGTKTYLLTSLDVGGVFSDSTNGITIQELSHDTNVAVVSVSFATPLCTLNNPSVSVNPLSKTGSKGQMLGFSVNITDNDSPGCSNSSFNLTQILPSGFTGSFSQSTVTLAPSASTTVNWNVTSDATALDGTYTISPSAANASDSSKVGSNYGSYVVFSDSIPPIVSILNPLNGSSISGQNITITATAVDDIRVTKVEFYIDNRLDATDTSTPYSDSWNIKKVSNGSHSIMVKAYDSSNNVSTASITVNKAANASTR